VIFSSAEGVMYCLCFRELAVSYVEIVLYWHTLQSSSGSVRQKEEVEVHPADGNCSVCQIGTAAIYVRFEDLIMVNMKTAVFSNVIHCSLVESYQE
jgi:hypothetical protein